MGYCIDVVDHYILIPTEQKAAALEAIKAMAVHDNKMGEHLMLGVMPFLKMMMVSF